MTETQSTTPGELLPDYDDDLVYDLFRDRPRSETDPVELLIELRDHIESMPKTKTTFKLNHFYDKDGVKRLHAQTVNEAMKILGVWRVPDHYAQGSRSRDRWVNPHSVHAYRYSDCYVTCECGALHTFASNGGMPPVADATLTDHEDCHELWRARAACEVWENRAETFERCMMYDPSAPQIRQRLGYKPANALNHIPNSLAHDAGELRRRANRHKAHTTAALADRYSLTKIGEALGWSGKHMRRKFDAEFDSVDFQQLYACRRGCT